MFRGVVEYGLIFCAGMLVVITRNTDSVGTAIKSASEHRTYTVQQGVGGHSGDSFSMVRTIVTQEELPPLIDAIEMSEPHCFYYHHDIEGISRRYYITPIG